jgi:hypothetical protein
MVLKKRVIIEPNFYVVTRFSIDSDLMILRKKKFKIVAEYKALKVLLK